MKEWRPAQPRYPTGVFAKYAALVSSAWQGAITRLPKIGKSYCFTWLLIQAFTSEFRTSRGSAPLPSTSS